MRVPRIPIVSTIALLLLAAVLTLWARSNQLADVLTFYTPAGKLCGLAAYPSGFIACSTDIPFDSEMALGGQAMSVSPQDLAAVHDLLFDPSNEKWHFIGLHRGAGTLRSWGWTYHALLLPYWVMTIPLLLPPMFRLRGLIIHSLRKRRGLCVGCGYDLRESPQRCPECGKPVNQSRRARSTNEAKSSPRCMLAGALSWLVVGIPTAACAAMLMHGRHAAAVAATAPAERAVLGRMIGPIDFPRATPMQTVAALSEASGTPIKIDGIDLAPSLQTESTFPLMRMPLDSALRAACATAGVETGTFQIWANGSVAHIGPASQAPRFVRSYPVAQVLHDIDAYLERDIEGSPPDTTSQVSDDELPSSQNLKSLITDALCHDDWQSSGGNLGGLWISAGRLWVFQTQEGHQAVRTLLAAMESPAAAETERLAEDAHANLDQTIGELKLDSATPKQAIEALRQMTHANILVYWDDLEKLGVKTNATVSLHLWNVSLDRAMGAILSLAGADDQDYPAMREVRDGIIVVGSTERIRNSPLEVRMYDIRDLVEKLCSERRLQPTPTPPRNLTFDGVAQEIADFIEHTVDVYSWKDQGGTVGSTRQIAGRLLITQTPAAHRQIVLLVRALRSGTSREGTNLYPQSRKR